MIDISDDQFMQDGRVIPYPAPQLKVIVINALRQWVHHFILAHT